MFTFINIIDKNEIKSKVDFQDKEVLYIKNGDSIYINEKADYFNIEIINNNDLVLNFEKDKSIVLKDMVDLLKIDEFKSGEILESLNAKLYFLNYDVLNYADLLELLGSSTSSALIDNIDYFNSLESEEKKSDIKRDKRELKIEDNDTNSFQKETERPESELPDRPKSELPDRPNLAPQRPEPGFEDRPNLAPERPEPGFEDRPNLAPERPEPGFEDRPNLAPERPEPGFEDRPNLAPERPEPGKDDNLEPKTPIITLISDSSSDNNKSTVSIYGKGTPFAIIEIFNNGVSLGFTTVDKDGNWEFTPNEFSSGTHLITAKESNNNGDTSESSEQSKVVIGTGADEIYPGLDGGNSVDYIYGGKGGDTINSSTGADIIDGGKGTDGVSYEFSNEGVKVDLSKGEGSGGHAEGDKLINIEDIYGSSHDDIIIGDKNYNTVQAGSGDDIISNCEKVHGDDGDDIITGTNKKDSLYGDNGNDTINAGAGNDKIYGGSGDDILYGEKGNDKIFGNQGNDYIDAGDGIDTVGFSGNLADYIIKLNPDGSLIIIDNRDNSVDGEDEIHNAEFFRFNDEIVSYEDLLLLAQLSSLNSEENIDLSSIYNMVSSTNVINNEENKIIDDNDGDDTKKEEVQENNSTDIELNMDISFIDHDDSISLDIINDFPDIKDSSEKTNFYDSNIILDECIDIEQFLSNYINIEDVNSQENEKINNNQIETIDNDQIEYETPFVSTGLITEDLFSQEYNSII